MAARLSSAERGRSRRPAAGPTRQGTPERPARTPTAGADLEGHCLSLLLRRRGLLSQLNDALAHHGLDPLRGQDFGDAGMRAILEAWAGLLQRDPSADAETLAAELPADLQGRVAELLAPDDLKLPDEHLVRDAAMTLLRLRERHLKRLGQELRFLTLEAQEEGDIRASQYVEALQTYKQTLLRTQQALADRWGWAN